MVLLMILVWHWRRRARAKETAVKMTMVLTGMEDNEPLRPSNVKPNTAKLRIVKEVDLRIGSELGNGAFGVVYKVRNISIVTSNKIVFMILPSTISLDCMIITRENVHVILDVFAYRAFGWSKARISKYQWRSKSYTKKTTRAATRTLAKNSWTKLT